MRQQTEHRLVVWYKFVLVRAKYLLVLITSTNGTSATAALKREGNMFKQAPISKPWKTIKRKEIQESEKRKKKKKQRGKETTKKDKEEEKKKWESLTSSLDVFRVKNNNDNKGREGKEW